MTKFRNKTIFSSFKYAFRGIFIALKSQRNFRAGFLIALAVILSSVLLKFSFVEIAITVLTIGFVLFAELVNTVIEFIVDTYFGDNHSEIAKTSKDIAAGTVLFSIFISAVIGGLLFLPKVICLIQELLFEHGLLL